MRLLILTGGQTGADIGAWRAARSLGIPTGGYCPRGFLTEEGPHPEYRELYGAIEYAGEYRDRTMANIMLADHILAFGDRATPGGRLLLDFAIRQRKTVCPIPDASVIAEDVAREIVEVFDDLGKLDGGYLMVGGNRESFNPGIESWVFEYMIRVLKALDHLVGLEKTR